MKRKTTLSNNPQEIDKYNWYYEGDKGIELIHEVRKQSRDFVTGKVTLGDYIRTDHIIIPWRKLKATMKRFERMP
jgi:hypothetical protein